MKAFLMAMVALVVLTYGADMVLRDMGYSSEQRFSTNNVRLGE